MSQQVLSDEAVNGWDLRGGIKADLGIEGKEALPLPMQLVPSSLAINPAGQIHKKLPSVFSQRPWEQRCWACVHSSTSVKRMTDQRISQLEHGILRLLVRETPADSLCPTSLHRWGPGDMTVLLKHLKGCDWEEGIRTVHIASKAKTTTVTLVFQRDRFQVNIEGPAGYLDSSKLCNSLSYSQAGTAGTGPVAWKGLSHATHRWSMMALSASYFMALVTHTVYADERE